VNNENNIIARVLQSSNCESSEENKNNGMVIFVSMVIYPKSEKSWRVVKFPN
jgi:hypothetical protein